MEKTPFSAFETFIYLNWLTTFNHTKIRSKEKRIIPKPQTKLGMLVNSDYSYQETKGGAKTNGRVGKGKRK